MIRRLFIDHPASVNETYGEHFATAAGFGTALLIAGLACFVHAFLPWMHQTTASRAVGRLHDRMNINRARQERP